VQVKKSRPTEPSLFTPENLLREARRQKGIPKRRIPSVCVLDPDGDIVDYLRRTRGAKPNPDWACYHTRMYNARLGGRVAGIVGNAVGSSFAVLVAEEMFASGCSLLLSLASAGRVTERKGLPRFLALGRALRDEGTSGHYGAEGRFCRMGVHVLGAVTRAAARAPVPLGIGTSWTTDAPFRETAAAVRWARQQGADCVEMEAAGLYAFARARRKNVVCLAHVTNAMAQSTGDFEKGEAAGAVDSLALLECLLRVLRASLA
jgi:purine-nucleoside phosphorylase